jgi:hypothetical protein
VERARRLTIDSTVVFDLVFERRERHAPAEELFALFRRGDVELASAPLGHRLDANGKLAARLRARLEADGVPDLRQLAYATEATYPGEDLFPGQYVEGFREAWDAVANSWGPNEKSPPGANDLLHIETHVFERRDIFITDDQAVLTMCRRLRDEHEVAVEAMRVGDYLTRNRLASPP